MTDVWRVWHAGHLELEQCEPASGLIKLVGKVEGVWGCGGDPGRAIKPIICSVMSTGVSCNCTWKFTEAQRLSVLWQPAENIYYFVFGVTTTQKYLTHSQLSDEIIGMSVDNIISI